MARSPQITRQTLQQVAVSPTVRRALADRARRMLPRAQRVAAEVGRLELSRALRIQEGIRPGAKASGLRRSYARVVADYDDRARAKDARSKLSAREVLRRSARA